MARQKTPTNVQPHYLSIPEVAILLGLGRTKVYDLIKHEGLSLFCQIGIEARNRVMLSGSHETDERTSRPCF